MKALSDPNQVKIIKMLKQKLMLVCEIRAAPGLSRPMVSNHFKVRNEEATACASPKSSPKAGKTNIIHE